MLLHVRASAHGTMGHQIDITAFKNCVGASTEI